MLQHLLKLILCINVLILPFFHAGTAGAAGNDTLAPEEINGEAAILIDATSGDPLFEKNPDQRLYPASITKIATGIYAIENGNPDDIVTVSKRARYEEGTRVYLAEGEEVTLRKLEYGLLMNSGNDAATAIAEHLAGSVERFSEQLNEYLQEKTGVEDTHFTNAHGLHDPDHYTTASDMAKITQYAMKNPTFREIVGTKTLPWEGEEWNTVIVNHNKMLWRYEGATGVKNGFTDQARNTLVVSAKRGETELIAVTMKAPSSELAYSDVTKLLDFGFAHYETKQVAKAGETFASTTVDQQGRHLQYFAEHDLYVAAPIGETYRKKVTADGQLLLQFSGGTEYRRSLKPKQLPPVQPAASKQTDKQSAPSAGQQAAKYAIFVTWFLLNLFLVFYLYARRNRKRKMMKKWYNHSFLGKN
ncbi:D-alanyl-D-alanine carboxypeptidase [Brevibacillus humidisoli]|uniref:D-alanyl-D-alanine carboxypeptidase family protein n=1 Tax=Brevibacillus humidisoli TaxID=2895522 RepID=UPI001E2F34DD|nr:D-alanyl-D-alanine carboxypeptidase family protein [Brevibacillus humidisoli]UFJ42643.1 D-alanyl-D-alanine carboxypeptidase [Brevibacillus humidisoli]